MTRGQSIWWWTRWWAVYFPQLAYYRIGCNHEDRYDGWGPCLRCGAPWFGVDD